MPRLLAEVAGDAGAARASSTSNLVEPRRRVLRGSSRARMARGEIRADVDLELAVDLIVGPDHLPR